MTSCGSGIGFNDPRTWQSLRGEIATGIDPDDLPAINLACSLERGHDGRHQAYYGAGLFEWPDLTEIRLLSISIGPT